MATTNTFSCGPSKEWSDKSSTLRSRYACIHWFVSSSIEKLSTECQNRSRAYFSAPLGLQNIQTSVRWQCFAWSLGFAAVSECSWVSKSWQHSGKLQSKCVFLLSSRHSDDRPRLTLNFHALGHYNGIALWRCPSKGPSKRVVEWILELGPVVARCITTALI